MFPGHHPVFRCLQYGNFQAVFAIHYRHITQNGIVDVLWDGTKYGFPTLPEFISSINTIFELLYRGMFPGHHPVCCGSQYRNFPAAFAMSNKLAAESRLVHTTQNAWYIAEILWDGTKYGFHLTRIYRHCPSACPNIVKLSFINCAKGIHGLASCGEIHCQFCCPN